MWLLDLFCGAGGAAKGYADAGFGVLGVDIAPQPRFPYTFLRADAMEILRDLAEIGAFRYNGITYGRNDFDVIHASPPCQHWSALSITTPGTRESYPDLISPTRTLLQDIGKPYVIENVAGAPLKDPLQLCGTSFGLRIRRHRLFESSAPIPALACQHDGYVMNPENVEGRKRMRSHFGVTGPLTPAWAVEMGVPWMRHNGAKHEAREAIPPVYTEYIGAHLMSELEAWGGNLPGPGYTFADWIAEGIAA